MSNLWIGVGEGETNREGGQDLSCLGAVAGQTVERPLASLQELRQHVPQVQALNDEALERLLEKAGDLQQLRGQLVEELAAGLLSQRADDLGPGCLLIRGDQIRLDGKQATDGMILRLAEDGVYDVLAIAEAKAGRASARELAAARESFNNLSKQERDNLEGAAIEELRQRLGVDPESKPLPAWAGADQLRQTHPDEIAAIMRQLHGPDMGQLERDLERLMPGIDEQAVTVEIDGSPCQIRVSRAQTEFLAITPSDISAERMLETLAEKGIRAQPATIDLTAGQVTEAARQFQQFQQPPVVEKVLDQVPRDMMEGKDLVEVGKGALKTGLEAAAEEWLKDRSLPDEVRQGLQKMLNQVIDDAVDGQSVRQVAEDGLKAGLSIALDHWATTHGIPEDSQHGLQTGLNTVIDTVSKLSNPEEATRAVAEKLLQVELEAGKVVLETGQLTADLQAHPEKYGLPSGTPATASQPRDYTAEEWNTIQQEASKFDWLLGAKPSVAPEQRTREQPQADDQVELDQVVREKQRYEVTQRRDLEQSATEEARKQARELFEKIENLEDALDEYGYDRDEEAARR
jgi:hypothetical protein